MGPSRHPFESESTYRLRYAGYCFRWFACLAVGLWILLVLRPSVQGTRFSLLVMFLYVGLPLGAGISGLAAIGYAVGGFWSRRLERNSSLAQAWVTIKMWLRTLFVLASAACGVFAIVRGLVVGEVWIPKQYGPLRSVSRSQDASGYFLTMGVWCGITIGLLYWQFKEWRRGHAT